MTLELAIDCRDYLGDRPCKFKGRCRGDHYDRMGMRILIVKIVSAVDAVCELSQKRQLSLS